MRFSLLPVLTRYSDRVNSLNFIFFSEKAKLSDRITRHFFKNVEQAKSYIPVAFFILVGYFEYLRDYTDYDIKFNDFLLALIVFISYILIERYILKFNLIKKINNWHDFISLEAGKEFKMIHMKTRWFEQKKNLFPENNFYTTEKLTMYREEIKFLILDDFNSRKNSYNNLREYKHSDVLNVINKNLSINAKYWWGEYHYAGELIIEEDMYPWSHAFVFYQVPSKYDLKDAVQVKVLSLAELYYLRV